MGPAATGLTNEQRGCQATSTRASPAQEMTTPRHPQSEKSHHPWTEVTIRRQVGWGRYHVIRRPVPPEFQNTSATSMYQRISFHCSAYETVVRAAKNASSVRCSRTEGPRAAPGRRLCCAHTGARSAKSSAFMLSAFARAAYNWSLNRTYCGGPAFGLQKPSPNTSPPQ